MPTCINSRLSMHVVIRQIADSRNPFSRKLYRVIELHCCFYLCVSKMHLNWQWPEPRKRAGTLRTATRAATGHWRYGYTVVTQGRPVIFSRGCGRHRGCGDRRASWKLLPMFGIPRSLEKAFTLISPLENLAMFGIGSSPSAHRSPSCHSSLASASPKRHL